MHTVFIALIAIGSGFAQRIAKDMCNEFVSQRLEEDSEGDGRTTRSSEFPHMVALGFGSQRRLTWLCGGTLISEQFVLAAAHCTSSRQAGPVTFVRLGTSTNYSLNPRRSQNQEEVRVARIINHPDYKPPSSYNDIALLRLQRKVQFTRNVLPACLNSAFNVNLATKTLSALGWGKPVSSESDELIRADLRVVQHRECDRRHRRGSRDKLPRGVSEETQLCAAADYQEDTCQDDSDGSLIYKNGRFHYIVGISSFGRVCGLSRTPVVFTRVSAFVPWIESEVWS